MADKGIIQKALDLARQDQEFVFPHASKNPLAPMAYVKDFNEFFLPSAQMAIDELQGEEEYPAWAYALASAPFIGKPAKAVAKIAGKGGKAAAKTAAKELQQTSPEWVLVKEKTPVEASVYGTDLDVDAIAKYYKKKELESQGVPYEEIIRMLGD